MSDRDLLDDKRTESMWEAARTAGLTRRRFLALLAAGGAAAVLVACAPKPTPTATATPSPPAPPLPTPTPVTRPIVKPMPGQFFIPLGTNAEMNFAVMADRAYATPNSFFFVRNHSVTPFIDLKEWRLRIEGDGVARPLQLTYDELLKLPTRTVTRFVECAGNGRSFYDTLMHKPAQGGQWRLGAYGIAEWTGVPLAELLDRAGIKTSAVDVMPTGLDSLRIERPMPVAKAKEEDTIVAYLMNGDLLPPDHGFPVRMIAPGWVGIANIKWLGKVTVSESLIYVEKNTTSYVFIGPDYQAQPPAKGPILTTQVMKSACALPWPATMSAGRQRVVGYAWSPFGKISRMEVSLDGGSSYQDALLTGPNIERSGSRWEFTFDARPGDVTITPRATDDKGNFQHDVSQQKWNEQGYLFGAAAPHPVKVV